MRGVSFGAGVAARRYPAEDNGPMDEVALRVREFLLGCGFTADGVLARVGADAFAALGRDLTVPVRRSLADSPGAGPQGDAPAAPRGDAVRAEHGGRVDGAGVLADGAAIAAPLDRLIEAFLLADPIAAGDLPEARVDDLVELGMVRREGDSLVPVVEVRPYGEPDTDWYLISDIGSPASPDHVLGLGGASLTLARITPRRDVGRALDLGCGTGVQALHAARHASRVVCTDTNPRALEMTALSAALSGIPAEQVDLREGSLFGPVSDERFDLVVSNPPFVISPSHRFTYRDAGLTGDELSRLVVRGAAAHLAPGGLAAVLGNWLHVTGEEWSERVAEWVQGTGASAWIVQRDTQSAADYSATWIRDAGIPEGPEFDAAMQEWLDAFADQGCEAVGFGWIVLVAPSTGATDDPWVLVEDLAHSERLPRGDEVERFLVGCRAVEALPVPELLNVPARLVDGATITETTHVAGQVHVAAPPRLGLAGTVGAGGWRPSVTVPPALLAALLADPDTPIGERLDAAAQAEGLDPLDLLGPALMGLRELVRLGIVRTD
jgi:methylase of polypeptide subunit release factors